MRILKKKAKKQKSVTHRVRKKERKKSAHTECTGKLLAT